MDNSAENGKAHDRWSEFLANLGFSIRDKDSIERCCAALKATFRCGLFLVMLSLISLYVIAAQGCLGVQNTFRTRWHSILKDGTLKRCRKFGSIV